MTSARANTPAQSRGGSNNTLLELIDRILDKGLVIDAWARVSVLNIELLTIEARVVVASVETYLRYAEAIGNTALASMPHPQQAQQQGIQQPGGQQAQALPQPQQNAMPHWQAQSQQAQQPQQQQGRPQPQQAQPQQAQPAQPQQAQPQQAQPQQQQQVQSPPPQIQQEQRNSAR